MLVPRLIYIETEFKSREKIENVGLDKYIKLSKSSDLAVDYYEEYSLIFHGILVQNISENELFLISLNEHVVLAPGHQSFCKWHTGSLVKRDDPLKRSYCRLQQYTRLGYCREHDFSLRAIYDKCFSSSTIHSYTYCRELDERLKGSIKYSIYVLDYGLGFKVGSTKKWRLLDRIGEQPHIIATELLELDSAVKTRELERKIGMKEGFTEKPHKRLIKDVLSYPPKLSFRKLLSAINKLVRELNLSSYSYRLFRVVPYNNDVLDFLKAKHVRLKDIIGVKLEVYGYWLGYLLLADRVSNNYFLVHMREILHRDTMGLVK